MRLELPFPPQINHYYTVARGRKILSAAGRAYQQIAVGEIMLQMIGLYPLGDRVDVVLTLHAPDNRVRDAGNYGKAVVDSLVKAGVLEDDSRKWVRSVKEEWADENVKDGRCVVTVEVIEGEA